MLVAGGDDVATGLEGAVLQGPVGVWGGETQGAGLLVYLARPGDGDQVFRTRVQVDFRVCKRCGFSSSTWLT